MVLADRNSENLRNGRRSRGPSPSEHSSDLSTDEESGRIFHIFVVFHSFFNSLMRFILFSLQSFNFCKHQQIRFQIWS